MKLTTMITLSVINICILLNFTLYAETVNISYNYDKLNRLNQVKYQTNSSLIKYKYDGNGNITQICSTYHIQLIDVLYVLQYLSNMVDGSELVISEISSDIKVDLPEAILLLQIFSELKDFNKICQ